MTRNRSQVGFDEGLGLNVWGRGLYTPQALLSQEMASGDSDSVPGT